MDFLVWELHFHYGKSISFNRTGIGRENTGYSGYQFIERPTPITDEELDGGYCLDEFLILKDYEEIDAI